MDIIVLATVALTPGLARAPEQGPWRDLVLPNGIRAGIVHLEGAPKQSTFTFLPLGLLDDAAGKAQLAHLVEHLLIRSTDPGALEADGILMNGETTGLVLRLETVAAPAKWREALARHAKWLAARDFGAEVLEREKGRVLDEVKNTVAGGFTHKWAEAAWNQVVRHGADRCAVQGDVRAATAGDVRRYVEERLPVGEGVRVVTAGPIPADEVRKALEAELGALERREARVARRPARAREGAKPRDVKAAWDLDARHHVEWYPIPHETPADRAAAWALAMLLTARLQGEAALSGAGARALATADLLSPAGRFLAVSASLPAGADVAKVRAAIRSAIDRVLEPSSTVPSADAFLRQMAQQAGALPDFQLLRKQLAGQPMADVLEAQAVLTIAHQEISTGLARAELAKALRGLKAQDLEAFAAKNLGAARRSTLLLEPAADE